MSRDEMLACPNCEGRGRRTISEAGCCNNPTRTGECCGNAIEVQAEEPCDSCGGTGLSASLLDGSGQKIVDYDSNDPMGVELDHVQTKSADCSHSNEQSAQGLSRASLEPWRIELDEVIGHLGAAIMQSVPADDQIIMEHVKAAHEIARIVRRQA